MPLAGYMSEPVMAPSRRHGRRGSRWSTGARQAREDREGAIHKIPISRVDARDRLAGGERNLDQRMVIAALTETANHGLCVPAGETGRKALATDCVGNYMIVAGAKPIYLVGLLPLRRDYILVVLRSDLISRNIHCGETLSRIVEGSGDAPGRARRGCVDAGCLRHGLKRGLDDRTHVLASRLQSQSL